MSQAELKALLQQLHDELSRTDSLDADAQALLGTVVQDIQDVLGDEAQDDSSQSLVDRLKDATGDFEEDHPKLTEAVGQVIDALSRLGI